MLTRGLLLARGGQSDLSSFSSASPVQGQPVLPSGGAGRSVMAFEYGLIVFSERSRSRDLSTARALEKDCTQSAELQTALRERLATDGGQNRYGNGETKDHAECHRSAAP